MPDRFGGQPPFIPPLTQRVRDVTVAEAIAAEAGIDEAPELVELSTIIQPTIVLQPRPPLAISGYLAGTIGVRTPAVALNISHVGIFGSGAAGAIVRVNWCKIMNGEATGRLYNLRRVDSPFTGFTATAAVPAYINAGGATTGRVFSMIKNDTVAAVGALIAQFRIQSNSSEDIPGPWILNDGILLISHGTVDKECHVAFGYEVWPAMRLQPQG